MIRVPHKDGTPTVSKRDRTAGVLFAVAATMVGLAAPAAATQDDYLQTLQPRFIFLSESQLLSIGNDACSSMRSGVAAADLVAQFSRTKGISVPTANEIVNAAAIYLC